MSVNCRPLILIHGLWNSPRIFHNLIDNSIAQRMSLMTPYLPHDLGRVPLRTLAKKLDIYIHNHFGSELEINLLGFSMGGIVGRIWLQEFGGAQRTHQFLSVGSPHKGTYTASFLPPWIFTGVAEMSRNSSLLQELNRNISIMRSVICSSYYCQWDLMVFPGWQAVLPIGSSYALPVLTHKQLISHPIALKILWEKLVTLT